MIKNAEEFVQLRTSDDVTEQDIATREFAPIEVWLDVIRRYPDMKEWVVHNKKIQRDILMILAEDSDRQVRSSVARKGSAGEEILWKLSRDESEAVRTGVVANRRSTKEILEYLLQDKVEEVAEFAMKKLKERGYVKDK